MAGDVVWGRMDEWRRVEPSCGFRAMDCAYEKRRRVLIITHKFGAASVTIPTG